MMKLFNRLIFVLVILCSLQNGIAQSVEHLRLNNGLEVFIKPDNRAPIAIVMVWYKVGSSDEPGGLTGISHALEHMMFKGTPKIPAGQFSHIIAEAGGQENAFTAQDYTAYYEKISTRSLKTALKLEADRMEHLTLSPQEFAKEIKVVQEERRLRTDNNPQALTLERFMATAHLSLPYQHPTVGWMSDLEHLTIAQLKAWYEQYYAPNNAKLVILGDVNPKELLPWIKQTFGPIKKQTHVKRLPQTEPNGLGLKQVEIHAPAQQPILMLGYTTPSLTTTDKQQEAYTLEVIAGILDAGENARLTQSLLHNQHVASTVSAYYDLFSQYQTQFMLFGIPSASHSVADLDRAFKNEIQKLTTTLVPETELKRIKTQLIAQKTFQEDSLFGQALELGMLETIGLGHQVGADYSKKIQTITANDVLAVAKRFFDERNLTKAQLHPIHSARDSHEKVN